MKTKSNLILLGVITVIGAGALFVNGGYECLSFSLQEGKLEEKKCTFNSEAKSCSGDCHRWTEAGGEKHSCFWCYRIFPAQGECSLSNPINVMVNEESAVCEVNENSDGCKCGEYALAAKNC